MARASKTSHLGHGTKIKLPSSPASPTSDIQIQSLKKKYLIQNKLIATKNEELQLKITSLESQLFKAQRQLLALRNENIRQREHLKLFGSRFNDSIVDMFSGLMNQYKELMADLGVEIEKKTVPINLKNRVGGILFEGLGDGYLKKVNDDLRRRKSGLFMRTDCARIQNQTEKGGERIKERITEKIERKVEEEGEEDNYETVYEENEETDGTMDDIDPTKEEAKNIESLDTELNDASIKEIGNTNEQINVDPRKMIVDRPQLQKVLLDSVPNLEFKGESNPVNKFFDSEKTYNETEENLSFSKKDTNPFLDFSDEEIETKPKNKRISRELKNLDTEKTKKWIGSAISDENEPRRTSRRRKSINYQLPSLKRKMRRPTDHIFTDTIYDNENQQDLHTNRPVLKNITNSNVNAKKDIKNGTNSIFDFSNANNFNENKENLKVQRKTISQKIKDRRRETSILL